MISSLYKGCLGSFELPFEPLNTWGHPCAERRHPNLEINQIYQEFNPWKSASVLELRADLVMVKWRLRTCYSWCFMALRRSWWSEALGELLEFVGAPRRRSCTRCEACRSGDGEGVFLVITCSSWCKGAQPFVGAPTTRGASTPRHLGKNPIVSCALSFHSIIYLSLFFLLFFTCLFET